MNTYAQANADSDLYRTMKGGSVSMQNPFLYSLSTNYGSMAPHVVSRSVKSLPGGSIVEFEVPRSGLWRGSWLRISITGTTGAAYTSGNWTPLRTFTAIELRTRSNLIQRMTPYDIIDDAQTSSSEEMGMLHKKEFLNYSGTGTLSKGRVFTVPIPFACHDRMNNYMDTKITEPLIIRLYSTSLAEMANVSITDPAHVAGLALSATMCYDFVTLDDHMLAEYKAGITSKGERGAARLMWNSVQEKHRPSQNGTAIVPGSDSGTGVTEMEIKTRYPIFKTRIDVLQNESAGLYSNSAAAIDTVESKAATKQASLERIDLVASGVTVGSWFTDELRMKSSKDSFRSAYDDRESYEINFQITKNRSDQTGFLSFRHVTDARWVFHWKTYPAALAVGDFPGGAGGAAVVADVDVRKALINNVRVVVTNMYHTEEAIEPTDGNITITTLS